MHDLTFARSHARFERRRRYLRRASALSAFVVICSIAVYFAFRGDTQAPISPANAATLPHKVLVATAPPPAPVAVAAPTPSSVVAPKPRPLEPIDEDAIPRPRKADRLGSKPRVVKKLVALLQALPPPSLALDLQRAVKKGARLVAPTSEGEAVLTLIPEVHEHVAQLLAKYEVPNGAFAAIEPQTGKVLALASYSRVFPTGTPFALRGVAPAASIFKLVTAGALLEGSDMAPNETTCFHGGKRSIHEGQLKDSRRDGRCVDLASAVAWSFNVPMAKLAVKHITSEKLLATSEAFGFNTPIPFDLEMEPSYARIPTDALAFGRAAAGFGDVRLSALHGALLAGAIANGGQLMRPYVVDAVHDSSGQLVRKGGPEVLGIALTPAVAKRVAQMMHLATTEGTGRRHLKRGARRFLGDIAVPGKTGSLFVYDPFMDYSWFVGFAPLENPKIAFAAVVGNTPLWHIKSGYVAVEGLKKFFKVAAKGHKPPRALKRRWKKRRRTP